MRMAVSTRLRAPPARVFAALQRPEVLLGLTAPLLRHVPREPRALPEFWLEGRYRLATRILGVLPLGTQAFELRIRTHEPERGLYQLERRGGGGRSPEWRHLVTLAADPAGGTLWREDLTVAAGLSAPLILALAALTFRLRQARLRRLAEGELGS